MPNVALFLCAALVSLTLSVNKVKVATGWACPKAYKLGAWGSVASELVCEALCEANCTAYTYVADGGCSVYEACPVRDRVLLSVDRNYTSTFAVQRQPAVEVTAADIAGSGDAEVHTLPHHPAQQRESWTVAAWVQPALHRGAQVVVSTEDEGRMTGYSLRLDHGTRRWTLRVGNGTLYQTIAGGLAGLHRSALVVASYSGALQAASLEVDGVLSGTLGRVSFAASSADLRIGHHAFVGVVHSLSVYSFVVDTSVFLALTVPGVVCDDAAAPNIGMTTTNEHTDYGAAMNGMCLYLGYGHETCEHACERVMGGRCDAGGEQLGWSGALCEAALQRLGMTYSTVVESGEANGCTWRSSGAVAAAAAPVACDGEPLLKGDGLELRVCACEPPAETVTPSAQTCGAGGDFCTPCPELMFAGKRWLVVSHVAACAADAAEAIETLQAGTLDACKARCEAVRSCGAVDYYAVHNQCTLLGAACAAPAAVGNGSSSHSIAAENDVACSASGILAEKELPSGSVCECRDYCAGVADAVYGDFRSNATGGFCACYASCREVAPVENTGACAGCANVTSFHVDIDVEYKECEPKGVQVVGPDEASADGIDFGTVRFGGDEGYSLAGWFKRPNRREAPVHVHAWRIVNGDPVTSGWIVCDVEFYEDDDCFGPEVDANQTVYPLPRASDYPNMNASYVIDGDVKSCSWSVCGEFQSKLGCSPMVASFVFVLDRPINPRCVRLFQHHVSALSTRSVSVERLSRAGTWEQQWTCSYLTSGTWQGCSKGTGLVHVSEKATWKVARDGCARIGGDLVSIRSEAVNKAVLQLVAGANGTTGVWLGATRVDYPTDNTVVGNEDNRFQWVDETNARWFTNTLTMRVDGTTMTTVSHDDAVGPRDYSNWACSGQHPAQHEGDCVFMYGLNLHCEKEGDWGAVGCGTAQPGYVCNASKPAAPQQYDGNETATVTQSGTVLPEFFLPTSFFACGAGDDVVSLQLQDNGTNLVYSIASSAAANWPESRVGSTESLTFYFDGVPQDGEYHHLAILHRASGAVSILSDLEAVGHVPHAGVPESVATAHDRPVVWLAAANATAPEPSGALAVWPDVSQNGLDASPEAAAPLWVGGATPDAEWPAVHFGANASVTPLVLPAAAAAASGWAGLTLFAVLRADPSGAGDPSVLDGFGYWGLTAAPDRVGCFAGEADGGASLRTWGRWNPVGASGWVMVTCRVTLAREMVLRVNGYRKAAADVTLAALPAGGSPAVVGREFNGSLAELLVYGSSLPDSEVHAVERALAVKYFGGVFLKPPSRSPRRDCGVARNSPTLTYKGWARDVALWDGGLRVQDVTAAAVNAKEFDKIAPPAGTRLVRHAACTGECVGRVAAAAPTPSVGYASFINDGALIFEGSFAVASLPSGDQPLLVYGGKGCGPGALAVWVYPAARSEGSTGHFSIAVGEWHGSALRTANSYAAGRAYSLRVETDSTVNPPFVLEYSGPTALLGAFGGGEGWESSAARCGEGAECLALAGGGAGRLWSSDVYVLTTASVVSVAAFGSAGSGRDIVGLAGPAGTGFAGAAVFDVVYGRYVLAKHRPRSATNESAAEVLAFTPWVLKRFAGRKVRVELIDDCGGCDGGWVGFRSVLVANVNATTVTGKVYVDGALAAAGRFHAQHGPLEAGEISLLARCHNDSKSGSLDGSVQLTIGCPIYHGPTAHPGNLSTLDPTPTETLTLSATLDPECAHHFYHNLSDYLPGHPGNLGRTTFGGGAFTLSMWVKLHEPQTENAVLLDIGNAPWRDHRLVVQFFGRTGSVVYRVEEKAPYERTKDGVGDPEVGQVPRAVGAFNQKNLFVAGQYLAFVGCYSNATGFGNGAGGRAHGARGGEIAGNLPYAARHQYKYIALANTPEDHAAREDGGAYFFNLHPGAGDLALSDCQAVPCDSGLGLCGCAGGACGVYSVESGRCRPPENTVGSCALATQSWAVYEVLFPRGPTVPADSQWHHIGVIHKADSDHKMYKVLSEGTATLYIDHVPTHSNLAILPRRVTRVDSFVGKPNDDNSTYFVGYVKEVYLWDGELSPSELKAVAERTMHPTGLSSRLVKAAVQDCGVPDEGYGQCLSYIARTRDPSMCVRPICECSHNGFRCTVSRFRGDHTRQRSWGESWGVVPLPGGGTRGVSPMGMANAQCYVDTTTAEGCQCEGEVATFSFDPNAVRHEHLTCSDVLDAFSGRLAATIPPDVLVPGPAGRVLCRNERGI
ncbi:hypothetical protein DIPPA_12013 [Diplonema papillatum]|nr:hypothetical protein DIPPA_12013 [Diplonema papillatum]